MGGKASSVVLKHLDIVQVEQARRLADEYTKLKPAADQYRSSVTHVPYQNQVQAFSHTVKIKDVLPSIQLLQGSTILSEQKIQDLVTALKKFKHQNASDNLATLTSEDFFNRFQSILKTHGFSLDDMRALISTHLTTAGQVPHEDVVNILAKNLYRDIFNCVMTAVIEKGDTHEEQCTTDAMYACKFSASKVKNFNEEKKTAYAHEDRLDNLVRYLPYYTQRPGASDAKPNIPNQTDTTTIIFHDACTLNLKTILVNSDKHNPSQVAADFIAEFERLTEGLELGLKYLAFYDFVVCTSMAGTSLWEGKHRFLDVYFKTCFYDEEEYCWDYPRPWEDVRPKLQEYLENPSKYEIKEYTRPERKTKVTWAEPLTQIINEAELNMTPAERTTEAQKYTPSTSAGPPCALSQQGHKTQQQTTARRSLQ